MNLPETKAFLEIVEKNKDKILKICWVYANDIYEQEDLFQEVLLNLWKSYPQLKEIQYASTWLYRICLNICMRHSLRSEKEKKRKRPMIAFHFSYTEETESKEYTELYRCINTLEISEKNLVLLYLEDLPYKEIAQIVGISENYVAVKIKRIREKLYQCLKIELYER